MVAAVALLSFFAIPKLFSQTEKYAEVGWQLKDLSQDSIYGASVERAYAQLLKGKKSQRIIVAVIDTGADTTQEDLQGVWWTNPREIPGNGIDDDHNGYVDDIHGWNFLGGSDGKNIETESYEIYREYYRLRKNGSGTDSLRHDSAAAYRSKVIRMFLEDSLDAVRNLLRLAPLQLQMHRDDSILQSAMQKNNLLGRDIKTFHPQRSVDSVARQRALYYFAKYGIDPSRTLEDYIDEVSHYLESIRSMLAAYREDPEALRQNVVRDSPELIAGHPYGNNNIAAGNTHHGTHISGIIAARRNNGIGMDGICGDVQIMMLRAVPNGGDERDKDIALAIRYAVDNGARIINMSFEKPLSPGKNWVDEAIRYAAAKDVLLIHAAGNNKSDLDSMDAYPNNRMQASGELAENFITVAASAGGPDSMILSRITNFSSKRVDIFAPGVAIYSTMPDNKYKAYSGTSFATPVVTGIAALVLSYYPTLSSLQLKDVLLRSAARFPGLTVRTGFRGNRVSFDSLSRSGGIVNAYAALKLAALITRRK